MSTMSSNGLGTENSEVYKEDVGPVPRGLPVCDSQINTSVSRARPEEGHCYTEKGTNLRIGKYVE